MLALLLLSSAVYSKTFGAVYFIASTGTAFACPSFPTAYFDVGSFGIREQANNDFPASTTGATLVLSAPANFEFEPGVGTVSFWAGRDIDAASLSVTATTITITYNTNGGGSSFDSIAINGVRFRGINAVSGGIISYESAAPEIAGASALPYANLNSMMFPGANAGSDQLICSPASATMDGAPLYNNMTGAWSVISGSGTFGNSTSPISTVSGLSLGENRFRWTINSTTGGCSSYAEVVISSETSGFACTNQANQFSAVSNIYVGTGTCTVAGTKDTFTLANPGPFNEGDKVLIIQMQGAIVNTTTVEPPTDAVDLTFGSITNYNSAGNYEFAVIDKKIGSKVTFVQNLKETYVQAGKVQMVTVPQYANHTIPVLYQGTPWNGTTGGVMVFEVIGTLSLNNNINMNGRGFPGGARLNTAPGCDNVEALYWRSTLSSGTAFRGSGITDFGANIYGRGAFANAGGGGGGHNSGGGGGGNRCPGGRGGYEFATCYSGTLPYASRPPYSSTAIIERRHGRPGFAVIPNLTRVFMGGGGGGANGDGGPNMGGAGGAGGGIIIISAGEISGTNAVISSNGIAGESNGGLDPAPLNGPEGSGGGGAGGSVLLNVGVYSIGSLIVRANGGKGGDNGVQSTCHGTGGGGGGGQVRTFGASVPANVTRLANGGAAGMSAPQAPTNACYSTYGSVAGTTCTPANNLLLNAAIPCCSPANLGPDQPLCGLGSITLNNGTLGGTTNKIYTWYRNGVPVATGPNIPTYDATTIGAYSVRVDSIVGGYTFCSTTDNMVITSNMPVPFVGPDQVICNPAYIDLYTQNINSFPAGTTWQWYKDGVAITGATTSTLLNVREASSYRLAATASGCPTTIDDVVLTSTLPTVVDDCRETAGTLTLSASGGGSYEWYTAETGGTSEGSGTNFTTPSISTTTTYWVQDNAAVTAVWGAKQSQTIGSGGSIGNASGTVVQVFQVYQTVTLNAVTINTAAASGSATIKINVRSGTTNTSPLVSPTSTVTVTQATVANGFYTINFPTPIVLAPGTYCIDPSGTSINLAYRTLGSNISGVSYPLYGTDLAMGNMVSFDRTDDPTVASQLTRWACFYDFQFSYMSACARVPVVAQIGGCSPLPVSIINFSGENRKEDVLLNWSTAFELNNDHFQVQRSGDGDNFETIGKVSGNGTSSSLHEYSFVDNQPVSRTLYYRLVQVDIDGSETMSKIIIVNNDKSSVITVFPNPFDEGTNIVVSSSFNYNVEIKVSDLTGRVLYYSDEHSSNETIALGEGLSEGMYIVEVRSEYEIKTVRIVKMNK